MGPCGAAAAPAPAQCTQPLSDTSSCDALFVAAADGQRFEVLLIDASAAANAPAVCHWGAPAAPLLHQLPVLKARHAAQPRRFLLRASTLVASLLRSSSRGLDSCTRAQRAAAFGCASPCAWAALILRASACGGAACVDSTKRETLERRFSCVREALAADAAAVAQGAQRANGSVAVAAVRELLTALGGGHPDCNEEEVVELATLRGGSEAALYQGGRVLATLRRLIDLRFGPAAAAVASTPLDALRLELLQRALGAESTESEEACGALAAECGNTPEAIAALGLLWPADAGVPSLREAEAVHGGADSNNDSDIEEDWEHDHLQQRLDVVGECCVESEKSKSATTEAHIGNACGHNPEEDPSVCRARQWLQYRGILPRRSVIESSSECPLTAHLPAAVAPATVVVSSQNRLGEYSVAKPSVEETLVRTDMAFAQTPAAQPLHATVSFSAFVTEQRDSAYGEALAAATLLASATDKKFGNVVAQPVAAGRVPVASGTNAYGESSTPLLSSTNQHRHHMAAPPIVSDMSVACGATMCSTSSVPLPFGTEEPGRRLAPPPEAAAKSIAVHGALKRSDSPAPSLLPAPAFATQRSSSSSSALRPTTTVASRSVTSSECPSLERSATRSLPQVRDVVEHAQPLMALWPMPAVWRMEAQDGEPASDAAEQAHRAITSRPVPATGRAMPLYGSSAMATAFVSEPAFDTTEQTRRALGSGPVLASWRGMPPGAYAPGATPCREAARGRGCAAQALSRSASSPALSATTSRASSAETRRREASEDRRRVRARAYGVGAEAASVVPAPNVAVCRAKRRAARWLAEAVDADAAAVQRRTQVELFRRRDERVQRFLHRRQLSLPIVHHESHETADTETWHEAGHGSARHTGVYDGFGGEGGGDNGDVDLSFLEAEAEAAMLASCCCEPSPPPQPQPLPLQPLP